jgi:alkaline phosphatase D
VFDPEGRERLFSFIEQHHIPGVLLLSGDRHGARGFRILRPSGYKFYEFEPASLGGRGISVTQSPELGDNYLFGLAYKYAFGEFTFDTQKEDPTVTFRLVLADGSEYYKTTLTRSQLTP